MNRLKVFSFFYLAVCVSLFLYTFTQVDLSLTLSKSSYLQSIQKVFQHVGWFDRPTSTAIFIFIIFMLAISYLYLLVMSYKKRISRKFFWTLILLTTVTLVFSYNALSYDLFNYIFDAKIVTHYHQNPYLYKALDYPGEPMLSFMRWTHRTYPYGPLWLAISVPLSFIGANIFLLTFFIFKITTALFFLGSLFFLEKIAEELKLAKKTFALVLFAFNPLVLVECLVSSHNDIVMMFFALTGYYFLLKRKYLLSVLFVILSFLVKSVTIVILVPVFLSLMSKFSSLKFSENNVLRITIISLVAGFIFALTKLEIQPWYFLWVLPFVVLLRPNKYVVTLVIMFSFGLVLTYLPNISIGNYVNGAPFKLFILPPALVLGVVIPLFVDIVRMIKLNLK